MLSGVREAARRRGFSRANLLGGRPRAPPAPFSPGCVSRYWAQAGFTSATEAYEPRWTRARQYAEGQWEAEQARLDCRFDFPPSDPLTYGDVVVSHPEGTAWVRAAADRDGATAEGAPQGKHRRYPAWALPGGRLVPFSVETFGRWGKEALDWLRDAAHELALAAVGFSRKVGPTGGSWGLALPPVSSSAEGERRVLAAGGQASRSRRFRRRHGLGR